MKTRTPDSRRLRMTVAILFAGIWMAQSATVTVTTTADSGPGSLRQVITGAGSGDTITFTNSLSGQTIFLTSGQIRVDRNLVIDGSTLPGGVAINGNGASRIFEFTYGTTNVLTGLTLTNGYAIHYGGAISNVGTLTVNACTLSRNTANTGGAIFSHSNGGLTLNNSTLFDNSATNLGGGLFTRLGPLAVCHCALSNNSAYMGGAICNESSAYRAMINDSTLSDNSATFRGGGIYNESGSGLALSNCTLSGNSAVGNGGGIYNYNPQSSPNPHIYEIVLSSCTLSTNVAMNGGGIYNYCCSATLVNCTLSSNAAGSYGGGVRNNLGVLALNSCSLSENFAAAGGGIYNYSSSNYFMLSNCIVAGNSASNYKPNVYGPFTGDHNFTDGDPMLAPLGNYGGSTQTMPPLNDSPVIDAGLDTGDLPSTDQRGYPRVAGSAADMGAVEVQNSLVVMNTNDSGVGSLRDAITGISFGGGSITFSNSLSGGTILLTNGQLYVDKALTIDASALTNGIAIDGNSSSRIFEFSSNTTNTLIGMTMVNGYHSNKGGAIYLNTNAFLAISGCAFTGNSTFIGGGAIRNYYGTLAISNSALSANSTHSGGAIQNAGALSLNNCILSWNTATIEGGAIENGQGATLTAVGSTMNGNSANYGGAIYNLRGATTLNDCMLSGNSALDGLGGAIENAEGSLTLVLCSLSGNSASERGGGIDNVNGMLIIDRSSLSSNSALYGGGIRSYQSTNIINCTTLSGNSANYGGGFDTAYGRSDLLNCTLSGNSALFDGGGVGSASTLTLHNCTLSSNSATYGEGGGICHDSGYGTLALTNTIVAVNTASTHSNIAGSFSGANYITSGNPLLAPLGDYGGPPLTMPPFPGSPAIDAGDNSVTNTLSTDQRGCPRVVNGTVDIGATEFQGPSDVARFWPTDWDGDGHPFGLELALGTDPLVADPEAAGRSAPYPPDTGNGITFGFNPAATTYTAWVVKRSLDLSVPNSFVEIFRYDGPTGITTKTNDLSVNFTPDAIQVIDNATPRPPAAFYELSIEPSP